MEIGTGPVPVSADASAASSLDGDVETLRAHAPAWAKLSFAGKIRHLRTMRAQTIAMAEQWVDAAVQAKGIAGTALAGEEWMSGPYALLTALDRLIATLSGMVRTGTPDLPGPVRARADGQVIAQVFPVDIGDRVLLNGVSAEIWMEPEVTTANLRDHIASTLRRTDLTGSVTLVLGAGNVASIPPLDVLSALYGNASVTILKLNPVNAYLGPVLQQVFSTLIEDGFVRIVDGGADVGAYLCAHGSIDAIHLTGGERTHDAIVFGSGPDGESRKRAAQPVLTKTVTSELGNVTPVIVVPGPWSESDLDFHAAHVATMKLHNAGANCIAAQVLVTAKSWDLADRFTAKVRAAMATAPHRPSYYPGSAERVRSVVKQHPEAEYVGVPVDGIHRTFVGDLDATNAAEPLFTSEVFGPVLAQTALPGVDAATFLRNAVAFCNETLHGTLGASILIHPHTIAALGDEFEDAIAALRYGSITINSWPGVGFLLPTGSWGAFPGNTIDDVGSGIGIVHNAYLFDKPQKTVVRAPFAPFPRSLADGERTLLPIPPWFVTHRRAATVGRRLFAYAAKPSPLRLLSTAAAAMRA